MGDERFTPQQIDEIKGRVSLEAMVGRAVKLRRAGQRFQGLCPFHHEKTPSFTVSDKEGFYHCFGCGAHGDAIRWVMETERLGFLAAVQRLAEQGGVQGALSIERRRVEREKDGRREPVDSAVVGRWIWSNAVPARGTIVEAWLRHRGLDPGGLPGAIDRLRFLARCPIASWLEGSSAAVMDARGLTAPAMVAPIGTPDGNVHGVHCTYLAPDGRGKARLPATAGGKARETRKMFGRLGGLGVWLTPHDGPGPMIAGEGIETTWSYAQEHRPCRAAAALSLENLQGGQIRLKDGTQPLWRPRSDPARPPMVLHKPGDVILLVDADMQPLRDQKVQLKRGERPVRADISPIQRAELCAALAGQAWRRAGAIRVRAVRPPMGMDFNDELRSRAA
jgi:hypothetical protein